MNNDVTELLIGAISTCYLLAGLFFLKFWKTTHDKFFLFFALSFLIEGINRVWLLIYFDLREGTPSYYVIRVLSYSFIIAAILHKNRQTKKISKDNYPEKKEK